MSHILRDLVRVTLANKQGITVTVRSNEGFLMGWANTRRLCHDDLNGCWPRHVAAAQTDFSVSAVVTRMRMRCYGRVAHGTYKSVIYLGSVSTRSTQPRAFGPRLCK